MKFNLFTVIYTFFFVPYLVSSQQCRSFDRQVGQCVIIKNCPPLLRLLHRTPSASELRRLQRLTCGFDGSDPKVCCPLKLIYPPLSARTASPTTTTTTSTTTTATTSSPIILDNRQSFDDDDRPNLSSHPNFRHIPTLKECSQVLFDGNRVVGGTDVPHGKHPWTTRIGYRKANSNKTTYYCGGSIITNREILTAAHCTEGLDEFVPWEVRLGENDSSQEIDCNVEYGVCNKAEDYRIEKIIPHANYSTATKQNDISIIRVDRNISFESYFIRPICLPFLKEYGIEKLTLPSGVDGNKAVVAGWGRTVANKHEGSDKLLEVTLPIKTNVECQSIYDRRVKISPKQMCAGGEQGKDSCSGDSGGGLVGLRTVQSEPHKRTKYFQLGIVSYGPVSCGQGGLPGVYTRISKYLEWILDNIYL